MYNSRESELEEGSLGVVVDVLLTYMFEISLLFHRIFIACNFVDADCTLHKSWK